MKINADVGRVRLYTREQTGSGVSLTGKPIFDGSQYGDVELMKLAIVTHPAQFPGTQPDEEVA